MKDIEEILRYFPSNIYGLLETTFKQNKMIKDELREIRIRTKRPIILKLRQVDILIEYEVSQTEILQILERLCNNSIYAISKAGKTKSAVPYKDTALLSNDFYLMPNFLLNLSTRPLASTSFCLPV